MSRLRFSFFLVKLECAFTLRLGTLIFNDGVFKLSVFLIASILCAFVIVIVI